ncbi:RPL35AA [Symbiodinium sp. KB8]|nr:RPL35AA [Symbiodinium sp. KB8]
MAESKSKGGQPVRLYVKGALVGYKGSKVNQYHHTSLIKVQNLSDAKDAGFYLGKRVAYIYKAKNSKRNPRTGEQTNLRVIWGRITRTHGTSGVVRAKFRSNLPPSTLGSQVRIMLYPSTI